MYFIQILLFELLNIYSRDLKFIGNAHSSKAEYEGQE